ncbi:hypothetical protein TSOC_009808, partial [Tetrabaena socialis]
VEPPSRWLIKYTQLYLRVVLTTFQGIEPLVAAVCVFMQVVLPLALIFQWVLLGQMDRGFVDLFSLPAGIEQLGGRWLSLSQGIVGTYVMVCVYVKDFRTMGLLLLQNPHLDFSGGRSSPVAYLKAGITVVYTSVMLLVLLVTFAIIARSPSPLDVVLSGVGALFILEIDDLLVFMPEQAFARAVGAKAVLGHEYALVSQPLSLTLALVCYAWVALLGFWGYFLYRINS